MTTKQITAQSADEKRIEEDKALVQAMIGSKKAMEAALRRISDLESALAGVTYIALELGEAMGDHVHINSYHHGEQGTGSKIVRVRVLTNQIKAIVAKVGR